MFSFWKKPKFNIATYAPGDRPVTTPPPPMRPPSLPGAIAGYTPKQYVISQVPEPRRRVAFVVFHGMGQQVPYETQSMIAERMLEQGSAQNNQQKFPEARMVRVKLTPKNPPIARIEFTVERPAKDGNPAEHVDVHIYEAYWAPLTEGKISFLESVSFLFGAALNGVRSCLRGAAFTRWMFGDFQDLPIKGGSVLALLSALGGLTVLLAPVALFYSKWLQFSQAAQTSGSSGLFTGHWVFSLASLLALGLYSSAIRYVLVEYVGDVAIYVSSYKVSRFEEVRKAIQQVASSVLEQVYSSRDRVGGEDGADTYSEVVLVGHSLGSVIAYDALNAAISWDSVEKSGRMNVVRRTRRLITFGSPLDKTAFLFRTQVTGPRFLRESLAAQSQPLILDYHRFRPSETFRWINIYSRCDVISGKLNYYDVPLNADHPAHPPAFNPVDNKPDFEAWIPFAAHVQYWHDTILRDELFAALQPPTTHAPGLQSPAANPLVDSFQP